MEPGERGSHMNEFGRALIGLGVLLILVGAVFLFAARMGLPLGRLPGDFAYRGRDFSIYFPLGTSIMISIVLTALLWLVSKFRR